MYVKYLEIMNHKPRQLESDDMVSKTLGGDIYNILAFNL